MLDMDRSQHGGGIVRSLRREKSPRRPQGGSTVTLPDHRRRGGVGDDLLLSSDGARRGGNAQVRKHASALKVESDHNVKIPTQHDTEKSSKKAGGASVKILMEKEMHSHVESRRHSPSVIAKLMGLDPLPARQPHNRQKDSVTCFRRGSSEGLLEKHVPCEERKQEFKDIFEVLETRAGKKRNWHVSKELLSSRRRDNEMAMRRQKCMVAKRLPTGDKVQNTDEFGEASEASDSSKDYGGKSLEEPPSLFERYLRDLHSFPAIPEGSHITILKSSKVAKRENNEICQKSERRAERKTQIRQNNIHKHGSGIFIPSIKEHTVSHSTKLSRSKLGGNIDTSSLPTRIVVLKPSLEKGQKSARIQSTSENLQLGNVDYRRHMEFRGSGSLDLLSDVREIRELSDGEEVIHRIKGSREIAKEITKHMRHNVTGDYVTSYDPGHNTFLGRGNLHRMAGASARTDSEAMRQTSAHLDGCYKSYSAPYLTETCASREGRKHLSERWMMTHKFQEVGLSGDGLSTLGEMLALSDRETPDMHSSSVSCQESSHVRHSRKHVPTRCFSPSGISSKDGWKNGCHSGLSRSKSLPASSTIYGSPNSAKIQGTNHIENPFMLKDILNLGSRQFSAEKSSSQKFVFPYGDEKTCWSATQPPSSEEEENKLTVKEIHVDQNKNSPSDKIVSSETIACRISDATDQADCMSAARGSGELTFLTAEQEPAQSFGSSTPATDECSPANNEEEIVGKETLDNQPEARSSSSCAHVAEEACSLIAEEVELPSPISVLEPPDENECSPASFERVSAELQGLRMRLELLKLESRETHGDRSVVSDEDAGGEVTHRPLAGFQPTSGDEEERESSYLLNVLGNSGFDSADQDALFSTCYSPESPVCPDVFEKLEKAYTGVTWARSERKLLFDFVNSVLSENLPLNMEQYPWAKPRRRGLICCRKYLTEEALLSLLKQRKIVSGAASGKFMDDVRWLDLADGVDSIGREVEKMLKDDLIEELVSDIISA